MRTALAVLLTLVVVIGGVPIAATAQQETASVSFDNQATGGTTVVVDSVTLPDGGFVTIHDASVTEGNVLGSVAGSSAYLEPGTHENVTVSLDDPVAESGTYVAMPHVDSDGDRVYSFVAENGEADGPYTADGGAVIDDATVNASATVSMSDQPTTGDTVVVDRVELSQGGFVTIHDASVTEGAVFESIRGTSSYLEAGVHENVRVELDSPVSENTTLVPMAHMDTDDDQTYTFPESEGETDGPYVADGGAVVDTAAVSVSDTASIDYSEQVTGGYSIVVDSVFLPEGGFVTVHDGTVTEGAVFESIRGTSDYLEPGYYTDVRVELDTPLNETTTVVPMAHVDSDGDETYTFPESEGEADGPYTADGSAVIDSGNATVSASVDYSTKTSDGTTVVVDRVELSQGGFVTIHDASLLGGAVFESVVGTSEYLEPGVHEDVAVTLDEPIRSSQTLVPMAHMDTDGDEAYTFVEGEGDADGPYTADGGAVIDSAHTSVNAVVVASDQSGDGTTVTIDSVTLANGGFVTVHDASVTEGAVFESIRGTSDYLAPGTHENVEITLDAPLEESGTIVPMAHVDSDGDEMYTFDTSEGAADGPYVASTGAVVTTADYTVEGGEMTETTDEMTETTDEMTEEMTAESTDSGSQSNSEAPGFGVVVAVLALLAVAFVAQRRR
ncbi:PGF-CTERM sorting domain-containing protein [Haloferax namakaokahaiae]|uniref:PGF-CTERM sorting domain-containing protein n=1 Tax=Haloferax namakaokahaiae TaxID=1748331 RepID=A0ABD5ZBY6_9EURY